jgi:hypothetical protein
MERHCKNCSKMLYAGQKFCSECGSKWVENRLTPRNISAEIAERYLGTENVFIKTCFALFSYPENVINGYVVGQRKKYVNVINFFFISLSLFGAHVFILKNFYPELLGLDALTLKNENGAEYLSKFFDYIGILTSLFLPFFALAGWLVFYNKKYNFVEHMVLFAYAFGIINIISFLSTPIAIATSLHYFDISSMLSILSLVLIAWYYKRIFKLSFWNTVLKASLLTTVYFIIQIIITVIFALVLFILIKWLHPEFLEKLNFNINGKTM